MMRITPSLKGSAGLTLIELLCVVAIITVLAALLVPAISSVNASARASKCVANLKHIGAAVYLYIGDNDGYLPTSVASPVPSDPNSPVSIFWFSELDTYAHCPRANPQATTNPAFPATDSVFFCPAANPLKQWVGSQPDYACNERDSSSPGAPGVFSRAAIGWGENVSAIKLSMVRKPSLCLMVADGYDGKSVVNGSWLAPLTLPSPITAALPPGFAPRHGYNGKDARTGKFGALFCDGHVEMFSYGDPRLLDATFRQDFLIPF